MNSIKNFPIKLRRLLNVILPVMAVLLVSSCSDSEDEPVAGESRTVLVYMAADNNLSNEAYIDITEMQQGIAGVGNASKRLLVYLASPRADRNKMVEVKSDGSLVDIKEFPRGDNLTIARMREVFSLMKEYAPADHYGLVLWSHGTGWLNDSGVIDDPDAPAVQPKSWGYDYVGKRKMRITSLAEALKAVDWEYVYFDCCHMATVEVAYELREATPLIVASPTELGLSGMPYHKNVACLLGGAEMLADAVRNTYKSYANGEIIDNNEGCAISLIATDGLERLAEATRAIYAGNPQPDVDYRPVPYFRKIIMSTGIYDMWNYIEALTDDAQLLDEWQSAYNDVVLLALTTPTVYNLDATDFHGLGSQVIDKKEDADTYDYMSTSWWRDVVQYRFD